MCIPYGTKIKRVKEYQKLQSHERILAFERPNLIMYITELFKKNERQKRCAAFTPFYKTKTSYQKIFKNLKTEKLQIR